MRSPLLSYAAAFSRNFCICALLSHSEHTVAHRHHDIACANTSFESRQQTIRRKCRPTRGALKLRARGTLKHVARDMTAIDRLCPETPFKYLSNRPFDQLLRSSSFR